MAISTHILDTALGRPASGVPVSLAGFHSGAWATLATGSTDADGRCKALLAADNQLLPGLYRIRFDTQTSYEHIGVKGRYPFVEITFEARAGQLHYHIPLLLTPNSYATYRGS